MSPRKNNRSKEYMENIHNLFYRGQIIGYANIYSTYLKKLKKVAMTEIEEIESHFDNIQDCSPKFKKYE